MSRRDLERTHPGLVPGAHAIYARASIDRNSSPTATRNITVLDTQRAPRVQWQITRTGTPPTDAGWRPASGFLSWVFSVNTKGYGRATSRPKCACSMKA